MDETIRLTLERQQGFRFAVDFGDAALSPLIADEPPPLGEGAGPNPVRLLAAAVGDCLSSSLLFCLQRAKVEAAGMRTEVEATLTRNERGRLRIAGIHVRIHPELDPPEAGKMGRCPELFEDYCVVTESVREGIRVEVEVVPPEPLPAESARG